VVVEYVPAAQLVQDVAIVAPVVVKYVPAAQSVQAALPVALLYLPAAHGEQTPPSGPEKPTLHVQVATAVGELEFVGQLIHVVAVVAPTVAENFPAAQSVQTALSNVLEYVPAGQF
jgi:hypothetical protein